MFVTLKKDYFGQKAGTTLDIDEPHTKSLLEQGIVEAVKGDPYGPLMAKAVEAFIAALTKNIDQVITAAVQQMALAQTKGRKNAIPEIFGPHRSRRRRRAASAAGRAAAQTARGGGAAAAVHRASDLDARKLDFSCISLRSPCSPW
jgi:hypothetical protein